MRSCLFLLLLPASNCSEADQPMRHGLFVGDTRYRPEVSPAEANPARRSGGSGAKLVYLNFEGATLSCGDYDNSVTNDSWIACDWGAGAYSAFDHSGYGCAPRETCIANIVDLIRELWAEYNITFTTSRPTSGSYEMVMIGGSAGGGAAGLASLDCNDYFPGNISFAFSDVLAGAGECSQGLLATAVSQELAHALGLCHNNQCASYPSTPSVMCPYTAECFANWSCGDNVDSCPCTGMGYDPYCPTDYLEELLGPSAPDVTRPTISIQSPQPGQTVPRDFTLTVTADDDRSLDRIEVYLDDAGDPGGLMTDPPYEIDATNQPLGVHVYRVVAWDNADNSAEDSVTITVSEDIECTPGICCCGPNCCEEQCDCADLLPTGQVCAADGDCQGAECIANGNQPDLGRICTQACTGQGDCPQGYDCLDAGTVHVCWPSVGKSCASSEDCPAGACLRGRSGNYCTVDCSDNSGCPGSYRCASVENRHVCLEDDSSDSPSGGCAIGQPATSDLLILWALLGLLAVRFVGKR